MGVRRFHGYMFKRREGEKKSYKTKQLAVEFLLIG